MNPFVADQFCVFRTGSTWLGLPATSVREVLTRPEITAVPASSPILIGISHLRNEFLAVLDLGVLFGNHERAAKSQMLVVISESGPWGWLVDEVSSLASLQVSRSSGTDSSRSTIVTGTATHQGRSLAIVDSDKAMRYAETEMAEQWHAMFTV
jgi:chemotaxis signal transduction protein